MPDPAAPDGLEQRPDIVLVYWVTDLAKRAGFRIRRRRLGLRIIWPTGSRLADVLAFYDMNELLRSRGLILRADD